MNSTAARKSISKLPPAFLAALLTLATANFQAQAQQSADTTAQSSGAPSSLAQTASAQTASAQTASAQPSTTQTASAQPSTTQTASAQPSTTQTASAQPSTTRSTPTAKPPQQASAAVAQTPPMHPSKFVEGDAFSKGLHLPVYEWAPTDCEPEAMVLAVHGLTLHGTSYDLTAKSFASGGFYFVAPDMRGFGKCARRYSTKHEYCVGDDCKWKVDYDKSFQDIVQLAKLMKEKYPKLPLIAMGESLGCTLAIRLAGEHPELVDRIILSAPAVKLHPLMFMSKGSLKYGSYALLISPRFQMNLKGFVTNLVSNNPKISKEMLDDPLILKTMPLCDLIKTQTCVSKTVHYAKKISKNTPILIVQGGKDHCVIPEAIIKLAKYTHSNDQTLKWLDQTGHLLLETRYLTAGTVAALNDWLEDHEPQHYAELQAIKEDIKSLGGEISP